MFKQRKIKVGINRESYKGKLLVTFNAIIPMRRFLIRLLLGKKEKAFLHGIFEDRRRDLLRYFVAEDDESIARKLQKLFQ